MAFLNLFECLILSDIVSQVLIKQIQGLQNFGVNHFGDGITEVSDHNKQVFNCSAVESNNFFSAYSVSEVKSLFGFVINTKKFRLEDFILQDFFNISFIKGLRIADKLEVRPNSQLFCEFSIFVKVLFGCINREGIGVSWILGSLKTVSIQGLVLLLFL